MIVLRSATSAQRAGKTLAANGIPTVIVRPPASVTGGSCSHAVKFDCRFLTPVQEALTKYGISNHGVYRLDKGAFQKI
ncbi:MAG: DUF3343 domain-containing protein [Clostridiaceae bacterium]|nr:DUF3343 domain-containing protein [Clostridiaceae bacterium]MDD6274217.1 DUF3343 domain-containing protein [Clostridiaceae bacterium]